MGFSEQVDEANDDQESRRAERGLGLHMSRTRGSESESVGSVIRLAEAAGPLDLPYVITVGESEGGNRSTVQDPDRWM